MTLVISDYLFDNKENNLGSFLTTRTKFTNSWLANVVHCGTMIDGGIIFLISDHQSGMNLIVE
jgi:hypothetical protein